jgi:hypothetical protein
MKLINWIRPLILTALVSGAATAGLYSNSQDAQKQLVIAAIEAGELADLVAISGGLQQGIERGMLLSVFHEGRKVGELLVTRSERDCSVALITQISPNKSLSIGDRATPKVRTL